MLKIIFRLPYKFIFKQPKTLKKYLIPGVNEKINNF